METASTTQERNACALTGESPSAMIWRSPGLNPLERSISSAAR